MELRAIWKILRRRWWLIALPTLAAAAYAAFGALRAPVGTGYATSLHFTAAPPAGGETVSYEDSEYYPWLTSEFVVNGLTDWVKTGSFAEEVSAELAASADREIPAAALGGGINADNERSVMVVYLSWPDAEQLASIADAVSVVLEERSSDYFPQFGAGEVAVVQFDEPVITPVPPPLSVRLQPLVRAGLGLAAGIALAFLVEYLDPTVRGRGDIASLGFEILAEIPRSRR
jgi:capsular polysaccharide biosynthesis protein